MGWAVVPKEEAPWGKAAGAWVLGVRSEEAAASPRPGSAPTCVSVGTTHAAGGVPGLSSSLRQLLSRGA